MTLFPRSPAAAGGSARSADRAAGSRDALSAQGRREFLLRRAQTLVRAYPRPFIILLLLPFSLALDAWHDGFGDPLALFLIAIGATPLARDTIIALRHRRYALDYLALLAIAAAVAAIEFQVGAVDAEQDQLRSNVFGETGSGVNCRLGESRPIQRDQQARAR